MGEYTEQKVRVYKVQKKRDESTIKRAAAVPVRAFMRLANGPEDKRKARVEA